MYATKNDLSGLGIIPLIAAAVISAVGAIGGAAIGGAAAGKSAKAQEKAAKEMTKSAIIGAQSTLAQAEADQRRTTLWVVGAVVVAVLLSSTVLGVSIFGRRKT